jgi:putative zinc finger/helix-turn-helix YgiT family protein
MMCINCNSGEYKTSKIVKEITINGQRVMISDVECERCNNCNAIIYTHQQSLSLEKKRVSIELKGKPLLSPEQLRLLRKILNVSLDEISDLLQVGKNSYGRWERGEVDITPSMNLLVHNLIEKFPIAKKNLLEAELNAEIEKIKKVYLKESTSLGEIMRNITASTEVLPIVVCSKIGIQSDMLVKLENNQIHPESLPIPIAANIIRLLNITIDVFKRLLENSLKIYSYQVTFVHARTSSHDNEAAIAKARSMNKIIEKYHGSHCKESFNVTISEDYLRQLEKHLKETGTNEVQIK